MVIGYIASSLTQFGRLDHQLDVAVVDTFVYMAIYAVYTAFHPIHAFARQYALFIHRSLINIASEKKKQFAEGECLLIIS